jgi:hypothetical protein
VLRLRHGLHEGRVLVLPDDGRHPDLLLRVLTRRDVPEVQRSRTLACGIVALREIEYARQELNL